MDNNPWPLWSVHFVDNRMRDLLSLSIQINKETIETYSENTDEPLRRSFDLYVQLPVHVTNLLPVAVQCSIDVSSLSCHDNSLHCPCYSRTLNKSFFNPVTYIIHHRHTRNRDFAFSFVLSLRVKLIVTSLLRSLRMDEIPECSVEKDDCGLIVWRGQRH